MSEIPPIPADEMQADAIKGCEEQMREMLKMSPLPADETPEDHEEMVRLEEEESLIQWAPINMTWDERLSDEEAAALVELTGLPPVEGNFYRSTFWKSLKWEAPKESIGKESTIFFYCMMYTRPTTYSWFSVNLEEVLYTDTHLNVPGKMWTKLPEEPDFGSTGLLSAVAVPPGRIITFGGRAPPHREVSPPEMKHMCYTVSDDGKVIKSEDLFTGMLAEREFSKALVADGKLYVYGGVGGMDHYFTSGDYFCQVCDPDHPENGWLKSISYLREPPLSCHIPGGLFVDELGHKHQLFHSKPSFYTYSEHTILSVMDLESGAVQLAEFPFPPLLSGGSVVVDGFIYAYVRRTDDIRVYDLSKRRWIRGSVGGIDKLCKSGPALGSYRHVFLRHLGGKKLCLIHEHNYRPPSPPSIAPAPQHRSMAVAITVFRVENHEDNRLQARILSYKFCLVPNGSVLQDCLII